MRVLMVPVANRPECVAALRTTLRVARELGAAVRACHVRPHRYSAVALPPEAAFAISDTLMEKASAEAEAKAERASGEAEKMVADIAASEDFSLARKISASTKDAVVWSEQVGDPAHLMRVIGPFADLITVSRPATRNSATARHFMESALLDTSRPVLILPPSGARSVGKRIVIGWDRTQNAMRAVVSALPFLQRADNVSVLTSGTGKEDGPKARALIAYLKAWGIDATTHQTRGSKVNAIDDISDHLREQRADLLVMGSYSRSRLRERIFGGVTEHMLTQSKRPILTVHHG